MWPVTLSGRLPVVGLVSHYLTNYLIGRESILDQNSFHPRTMRLEVVSGIRHRFQCLSQSQGQVTHVLLTRSPLIQEASSPSSFDLHVLSTPPAFVLSQDQTLHKCLTARQQADGTSSAAHDRNRPECDKFETDRTNHY